jgi:putative transposase
MSVRARTDAAILQTIRASFVVSGRTYGARRMLDEVREAGHVCGRQGVGGLMRGAALWARPRRRARPMDHGDRPVHTLAPNVLDRQFTATAPNQKWVADSTYLWTREGWLFVAVVLDLFSRRVVGWSMHPAMTAQLVTDALTMAIWRRGTVDALLHHSDQGSQPGFNWSSQQRLYVWNLGTDPTAAGRARRHLQHEPLRQRVGQRGDGELLLDAQD